MDRPTIPCEPTKSAVASIIEVSEEPEEINLVSTSPTASNETPASPRIFLNDTGLIYTNPYHEYWSAIAESGAEYDDSGSGSDSGSSSSGTDTGTMSDVVSGSGTDTDSGSDDYESDDSDQLGCVAPVLHLTRIGAANHMQPEQLEEVLQREIPAAQVGVARLEASIALIEAREQARLNFKSEMAKTVNGTATKFSE